MTAADREQWKTTVKALWFTTTPVTPAPQCKTAHIAGTAHNSH